ncbi:prepilin peptidase [Rubripirellula amarantea]|nr:prepilin peptidase [Rubripirellula amarantea]
MLGQRLRSRFPLLIALLGLATAVLGYVFGLAHLQAAHAAFLGPSDLYGPRFIDVIVFGWCFWIGSSIGSFLNVVAWRMPRGESVNGRSYCPRCQTRLKARDNFPVFGWLMLGGRCRQCRLPISRRYPIVELVVGLSLTLIAIGQLYQLSLPYVTSRYGGGPLWQPIVDRYVLTTLFFHIYAVTISWAFALIRYDRNRIPARLVAWGIMPIILAMLVFPPLMIVSWRTLGDADLPSLFGSSLRIDAAIRIVTGLVAAAIIGRSLARGLCPRADLKLDPLGKSTARLVDVILIISVPGLIIGWQSVIALVVAASILAVLLQRFFLRQTDRLGSFAIAIPISLSVHLFAWWRLHDSPYWPSDTSQPMVVLAWAAIILLVPLWLKDAPEQPNLTGLAYADSTSDDDGEVDEDKDEVEVDRADDEEQEGGQRDETATA